MHKQHKHLTQTLITYTRQKEKHDGEIFKVQIQRVYF